MQETRALHAALSLARDPTLVRSARKVPVAPGVELVLALAASDEASLGTAQSLTGLPRPTLRDAAAFYIEQVLLDPAADNYRVLGVHHDAPDEQIRRHLALLMRWLHPDLSRAREPNRDLDRGHYVTRITKAWETLKSRERRASYDRELAARKPMRSKRKSPATQSPAAKLPRVSALASIPSRRRSAPRRGGSEGLLGRLLLSWLKPR